MGILNISWRWGRFGRSRGLRTGMLADGGHRITLGGAGGKTGSWPKLNCRGARVVQSVPGHDGGSTVELGRCGGALG
jgi:hypothetical protein